MSKILKIIGYLVLTGVIIGLIVHKVSFFKTQPQIPLSQGEKILEKLSLEKKIGQLFLIGIEDKTVTPQTKKLIETFHPGGVILLSKNISSPGQLKNLTKGLQEISIKETGLPLFIAVDQEGEPICRIEFVKEKTAQSKIKSQTEAYEIGFKRGQELRNLGINLNLAPLLDIGQAGDFIYERSFQKEPEEIANLAKSLILGQKRAKLLTAIKHFPGYGKISFNPEEKLAVLNKIPEILQFQKAMEANPELVMLSNVIYNELNPILPFAFSQRGVQFLKKELNFEGIIISDDLSQNSLLNSFSLKEIVTLPIQAGVDILIFSGWRAPVDEAVKTLRKAVKNEEISEERINKSVLKIIQLKQILSKL